MKLYHGTSARHLDSILENGIVPRGDSPSNWRAASSSDNVYLTTAYGMYFAQTARREAGEDLLIVEIDTELLDDQEALRADEDSAWFSWDTGNLSGRFDPPPALDKYGQAMHFSGILADLAEDGFDHRVSLELLGNCSHEGTVPVHAITRVLAYSAADGPWWIAFHDPVISPMNFRFNGPEYVATQLVVAGRLEEARAVPQFLPGFLDLDAVEARCARYRTVHFDLDTGAETAPAMAPS